MANQNVAIHSPNASAAQTSPFPLNMWYIAGLSQELTNDKPLPRTLLNQSIVLFRTAEGQAHALEDRCCHKDLPLSSGMVETRGIRCGYHGLLFEGGGKCIEIPGQEKIPAKALVQAYTVKEQDALIWIWFGSEGNTEPTCEPPSYPVHSDERYQYGGDVYRYQAPYQLIHDNILDLSHLGYVHPNTIGGNAKIHMNADMKVTSDDSSVKVIRYMRDSTPPPTYAMAYPFSDNRCDRWQEITFYPSHMETWTGAVNVNTEALDDPNRGGFHMRGLHGVTPETEESCFYFWTQASNPQNNHEEIMKLVIEQSALTFEEDREVIEAQWENMKRFPGRENVSIHVDVAPSRARRIIEKLKNA